MQFYSKTSGYLLSSYAFFSKSVPLKNISSVRSVPKKEGKTPLVQEVHSSSEPEQDFLCEETQHFEKLFCPQPQSPSLEEDPLWKKICLDISHLMGFFLPLESWDCKGGSLSIQGEGAHFLCPTEDMANFLRKYDFLVLSTLQKYFPALKTIEITLKVASHP